MKPQRILSVLVASLAIAAPALAGPPLLCHPFDIGNAKSLPWVGEKSWDEGQPGYKLDRLVADTEAVLTPFGIEVLKGTTSNYPANPIEDWAAGVKLSSEQGALWFNDGGKLIKSPAADEIRQQ